MFVPTAFYGGETPDVYDNLFRGSWDASNASSYPGTGTNWFNVSGSGTFVESNASNVTWTNSGSADFFTYSGNAYHSIASFEMKDGVIGGSYGSGWAFSVWAKPANMTGQGILSIESGGGSNRLEMEIDSHNNRFYFTANQENGASTFAGNSGILSAGPWYNLVYTFDGVTFKGYVNNSLVASGIKSNPAFVTSTTAVTKFYLAYTPNYYYNSGEMGMCEMWNRAISADEVTEVWNYHKARFGY